MEEFLTKLYSYDHFETYLIIAIIVLIILFIIILFLGKKDQEKREIEATKKLMQINEDTINQQVALNNQNIEQEKLENDTIIVPSISDLNPEENNPEPVLPVMDNSDLPLVDETPIAVDDTFKEEENIAKVEVPSEKPVEPVLSSYEEKPFEFEDFKSVNNNVEPVNIPTNDTQEISVPEFNFDQIVKEVEEEKPVEVSKPTEVFSSVYVPEPKATKEEEIELPALKKNVEKNNEPDGLPKLSDFNFDEISGETYDIK